ncbi:MAG: HAMP domain-containing histidine kinase [Deltaproteobacteria bacterium]|nr:HAMP domain-containing histidine kinase [Deltaproteobacteria bacterium]
MNALLMQKALDDILGFPIKDENRKHFWKAFSHDLRGSMVSMGAALKLIDQGVYGEMDSHAHIEIRKVIDRIRGLIFSLEEFLEMVISEEVKNGKSIPKKPLHAIKDIIQPVLKEIDNEHGEHKYSIHTETALVHDDDAWIMGNQFLLRSALKNLFKNAIKYGDDGRIGVDYAGCAICVSIKSRGPFLKVNVSNTGKTISIDDQELLFTRFSSLSNESGKKDGLGIGLCIVKDIVKIHGGDIWYEALPEGNGSNFIFTILKMPNLNTYDVRDSPNTVHSMNPSLSATFQLENRL